MNKREARAALVGALVKQAGTPLTAFTAPWLTSEAGKLLAAGVAGAGGMIAKPFAEKLVKRFGRPKGIMGNLRSLFTEDGIARKALLLGTGAAGIAAGVKGVEALHDAIAQPVMKARSYRAMLAENPSLRREAPHDVKMRFNTLSRFNPDMAADPVISGAFVRRALQFKEEGIQPMDVRDLISSRKDMQAIRGGDTLLGKAFATAPLKLAFDAD